MRAFLNTGEAADYLGIKERKLYELVSAGAVPCSKVTGKWLFPRSALDRWIETGLSMPQGFRPVSPPPIVGGSHDPLLEWAIRRSGSGLALLSIGSEAGLAKLAANEVAVASIHLHQSDPEAGEDANLAAVAADHLLHDAVVIAFARREQGLLVPPGNPRRIESLRGAVAANARFARRQSGAGAESLLRRLLAVGGLTVSDIVSVPQISSTGDDLAFAIRSGEADCGVATRAVADAKGLAFIPLLWERFDLAMRRRTYFESGVQALLSLMRTADFGRHAEALGGFDVADAGAVRFVR
jgi:putative molybdopterin biosynthesis protein